MATMITEVYEAFRKVGIPDPEAKHAAEALSAENVSTKADINGAEKRLMAYINEVEKRLNVRTDEVEKNLNAYIGEVEKRLGERISQEITALDDKLSEKFSREITDVKTSIAKQDRDMAVMKWMMATTIAGILSLVIKSFSPV